MHFFYHSRLYPLLRDGVADLHCMSDEYIVDDLSRERAGLLDVVTSDA